MLRSTFASMVDAASHHYPWLPVSWLLLDRYRSDQRIQHVTCPLLMLHGNADRIVPYESGRQLFELAPEQSISGVVRKFVTLEGIGHNNVLSTSWEEIQSSVEAFLISIDTD